MSSETSTRTARRAERRGSTRTAGSADIRPQTDAAVAEDPGFHVTHFFILLSLLAATVAVVMARPNAPENLVLVSLTVGAAGLAAFCFYRMLAPLVAPHADLERVALSDRMRADLEREKALTLRSIKELEFDRAMGKVSTPDFDEMAARLRARALGIMKQLDAGSTAYRELIERELAQRVGKAASVPAHANPTVAAASSPAACACGTTNDPDARFCKACGAKLTPLQFTEQTK